jgi:proline dehydrogenase
MPGETLEDALEAAERLREKGIGVVFTLLGENVSTVEEADEAVREYMALLGAIQDGKLDGQISVKPTQLGLDQGEEIALSRYLELVRAAPEGGGPVWIDMEDSSYRAATLRLYARAIEAVDAWRIGLCLQAYLRSTPQDLEGILSHSPTIRFVKGAYAEPTGIAFPNREEVDRAFFHLATTLLESGGHVAVATHDMDLIRGIEEWLESHPECAGRHEVQMLYGIRTEAQLRLAREGKRVRVLVSYGPAWFPWYMRRLAERPANLWFVVKNLFRR